MTSSLPIKTIFSLYWLECFGVWSSEGFTLDRYRIRMLRIPNKKVFGFADWRLNIEDLCPDCCLS